METVLFSAIGLVALVRWFFSPAAASNSIVFAACVAYFLIR